MIGETIGHFEIVARAGHGGMGEVFVAEHATIKTRVAIKVLYAHVSANTAHVQRFFNEARAVARIQHAGIVKIFDVGFHTNQRAYLIMEYLEGETLAARLDRTGRIAPPGTVAIARQIASILGATHHAGIIHRDLKPENVFLVPDRELPRGERVKLLDFGIAKLSDTLAGAGPATVGAIGTPAYMAPEQWSDSGSVDWRADVYSLGCMIYEMATGRSPFASKSVPEACAKHLHETPESLRVHAPDVPAAIDAFTLRLLAKDPGLRVASIEELERQLAELGASAPASSEGPAPDRTAEAIRASATTSSSAAQTSVRARSNHRAIAAIGAAGIALGALAVWWGHESKPAPQSPAPRPPAPGIPPRDASIDARAAAPESPFPGWFEAANPFVEWRGARWLAHQVTRREFRQFLESLPASDALRLQPVTGWDDRDPTRPVAWVTFERAAAFCRAIHARLPASDEWLAASQGAWGLDPAGTGRPGPLQEWTSTMQGGLVVVSGGHERMSPAERAAAARDPLMKSSEAQAGPSPAPKLVASETIGFRCVR
ncbi:MAG TPA: bifunctional serine/threonine-protein kinase/formylglycine-generating enzyme family protein [Kofleriaceae bacterium]